VIDREQERLLAAERVAQHVGALDAEFVENLPDGQ